MSTLVARCAASAINSWFETVVESVVAELEDLDDLATAKREMSP